MRYKNLIFELISYVSNNNYNERKWKLLIRDIDKLEALNIEKYEKFKPLFTDDTPLPVTIDEIKDVLRQSNKDVVNIKSMLDHFYNNLLHRKIVDSDNQYIIMQIRKKMRYIVKWLIRTNKTILLIKRMN
jgi:hypothetical protein